MEERVLTCINCPMGCQVTVTMEGAEVLKVEGNTCPRGAKYAETELTFPVRTLTKAGEKGSAESGISDESRISGESKLSQESKLSKESKMYVKMNHLEILDICAAPGGKTIVLASRMQGWGLEVYSPTSL